MLPHLRPAGTGIDTEAGTRLTVLASDWTNLVHILERDWLAQAGER